MPLAPNPYSVDLAGHKPRGARRCAARRRAACGHGRSPGSSRSPRVNTGRFLDCAGRWPRRRAVSASCRAKGWLPWSMRQLALTRSSGGFCAVRCAPHFGRKWHKAIVRQLALTIAIGGKADMGQDSQSVTVCGRQLPHLRKLRDDSYSARRDRTAMVAHAKYRIQSTKMAHLGCYCGAPSQSRCLHM